MIIALRNNNNDDDDYDDDGVGDVAVVSLPPSEVGILRRELRHMWGIVNVIMSAWGEQAAVFIGKIKRLAAELAEIKTYCRQL